VKSFHHERLVHHARGFVHLRYIRALVVAASLVLILFGFGASLLEIRHEVSHRAVLRFFARDHFGGADIEGLIRSHVTVAQLAAISRSELTVNPGGFVYARDGFLEFHPHVTRDARTSRGDQATNEELFARLAPLYFNADVDGLLRELEAPTVADRLRAEGRDPNEIVSLRWSLRRASNEGSRHAVLRRAAGYIVLFVPYLRQPYELTFAEVLRFYDRTSPEGRFAGTYEVHGMDLGGAIDEARAFALGAHQHYLAVVRGIDNSLLLVDYFRGRKKVYRILPVEHPTGSTLYKIRVA
jgi:hypothetical protein